jgi:signal transduction histidine kinase
MIWNRVRAHPRIVDLALVALLFWINLGTSLRPAHDQIAEAILGSVAVLPLLGRRRWPLATTLMVAAAALAMIGLNVWVLPFALGVALYSLTSTRAQMARTLAAGTIAAVAVAVTVAGGFEFGAGAARVVFLIAAALLGNSIRAQRAYVSEVEEKAARLERERDSEARRAAAEEQARIARELHDIVAHALSVIIVQAGAADDAFELDPERARDPIRAIDAAARAALGDLRLVLGTLQQPAGYEPQPGLAQLDRLIERVRATGLDVSLTIDGAQRPLSAAVDLSAFRIVQEALTNSLKHADAEHVRVRIRYGERLALEIRDDGNDCGNGTHTAGSGLVGRRERVSLLGGDLAVGPHPAGGFRVAAELPIEA